MMNVGRILTLIVCLVLKMEQWFFALKFFHWVTEEGNTYEHVKNKPKPSWCSRSAGSCAGSSNTGDVNNWSYHLSPRASHFHQSADDHVLTASNSVQLRVGDIGIQEDLLCTRSLNYKHPCEAFLLQGSSKSCVSVQIQLYSYDHFFHSFCFYKKPV